MAYMIKFMVKRNELVADHLASTFASYEWWVDLAEKALETADEFEMRLWEDDLEGIASRQKFGEQMPNHATKEIVFKGKIRPEVKKEILTNYLTKEGYIKWFSLFLKNGNELIFSSEHYGDETHVFVHTMERVYDIQDWARGYPIIWRVDVFECE